LNIPTEAGAARPPVRASPEPPEPPDRQLQHEPRWQRESVNRGYNAEKAAWNEVDGRARFTGDANTGSLKVSFFGPL
jgi:hypothetical protein